jgi:hypothetical protein
MARIIPSIGGNGNLVFVTPGQFEQGHTSLLLHTHMIAVLPHCLDNNGNAAIGHKGRLVVVIIASQLAHGPTPLFLQVSMITMLCHDMKNGANATSHGGKRGLKRIDVCTICDLAKGVNNVGRGVTCRRVRLAVTVMPESRGHQLLVGRHQGFA